jgi:hypothetical protein
MLKMGSININGTSRIGDVDAVYLNASFSDNNESFTENIANRELYSENQTQCDSDYDAFKEAARAAVAQMNAEGL